MHGPSRTSSHPFRVFSISTPLTIFALFSFFVFCFVLSFVRRFLRKKEICLRSSWRTQCVIRQTCTTSSCGKRSVLGILVRWVVSCLFGLVCRAVPGATFCWFLVDRSNILCCFFSAFTPGPHRVSILLHRRSCSSAPSTYCCSWFEVSAVWRNNNSHPSTHDCAPACLHSV